MTEYIERKAIRDALYDADAITMSGVKILNQFPAADVALVRHGQWIDSLARITPYCSACGHSHRCLIRTPNYCPNCGAKMDGELDE